MATATSNATRAVRRLTRNRRGAESGASSRARGRASESEDGRHRRDEAIAAAGDRRDIAVSSRRLAQRCAELADGLAQVVFLDNDVRPEGFEKLVLFYDGVTMFDEVEQRVEHLGGERHGLA